VHIEVKEAHLGVADATQRIGVDTQKLHDGFFGKSGGERACPSLHELDLLFVEILPGLSEHLVEPT
jgi:hypothetical protein